MAMSNLPSMRLVSWKTELGVGVILTSMPFFAKRPFSCATQTGQLNPPGNTMRLTGLGGAGGAVAPEVTAPFTLTTTAGALPIVSATPTAAGSLRIRPGSGQKGT